MSQVSWQIDGPAAVSRTLVLAHGAGQDMRSEFLDAIASALAAAGLRVVRFRFPYMEQIAQSGTRRPPDPEPVLRATWHRTIDDLLAAGAEPRGLLIGGKSLGGRMASLVAEERGVAGLVCLGYPFHPPGRPDRPRIEHLQALRVPTLICQGTRDPFGTPEEIAGYHLSPAIQIAWIEDGEHSFRPRQVSGRTWQENLAVAAEAVAAFATARDENPPESGGGADPRRAMMQIEHWDEPRDGRLTEANMRRKLTDRGYAVTRYLYPPGTWFPDHDHGVDKIDGVLSGRLRVTMSGTTQVLGPGDLVVVPKHVIHNVEVVGDTPVVSLDAVLLG